MQVLPAGGVRIPRSWPLWLRVQAQMPSGGAHSPLWWPWHLQISTALEKLDISGSCLQLYIQMQKHKLLQSPIARSSWMCAVAEL